jgi:hypothetical protein
VYLSRAHFKLFLSFRLLFVIIPSSLVPIVDNAAAQTSSQNTPMPLVATGQPVSWWFTFKFNSNAFPGCAGPAVRQCLFGGTVQGYKNYGQQFAFATSDNRALQTGSGCAGDTLTDPVGATFNELYNGVLNYVVWNDQFYDDPKIDGCTKECGAPWGHSKGAVAWDDNGNGFVMQVTTPSWPAAGSKNAPRQHDGNTLGCVADDDVQVSQHFFSVKLTEPDLMKVLAALANASVVTDPANPQIVHNGGPQEVQNLVNTLGKQSSSMIITDDSLSSGVRLISKPSALNVPPWQLVSATLQGVSLRTATWWADPEIPSTDANSNVGCWQPVLGKAGPVAIATSGQWNGVQFGLTGGLGTNFNHAKIGVSTDGAHHYAIFGDMNQQGSLSGKCDSSQNGRGGLFYVIDDQTLADGITALIQGGTAPTQNSP